MNQNSERASIGQRRSNKRPRVLVACQRCKSRRQKCDNASPECSNCSHAKVACLYSENAYPSSYVKRMEERVRQLEASISINEQQLQRASLNSHPNTSISVDFSSPQLRPQPREEAESQAEQLAQGLGLLSSCAAAEPHYFGFSAGLSLAHFVQVAIESGSSSADVSLPLLADRPFSNQALSSNATLAKLPSPKIGASYILAYLSFIHPLYPFLVRSSLWKLHGSLTRPQERSSASPSKIDIALLHLVYAIGSRCLQLLGKIDMPKNTPEGHFLSAMKFVTEDLKFTSIRSIEVTLLLAIHSMRSPSGTSVWHLSGLAIRQCLELGLHKQRLVNCYNARVDQHRKRLFWSAYIFERKTALVLGRPFALSDEEIALDLPVNVDDDDDEEKNCIANLGIEPSLGQLKWTNLSFHRFHVELYQIHTEIRLALHQLRRNQTREEIHRRMSTLFQQLENWQKQVLTAFDTHFQSLPGVSKARDANRARIHADGGSDSSENDQDVRYRPIEIEKAELLLEYHKARRSLLQPLMTEGREHFPFDKADYIACADASGQICQLYRRLHRLSPFPFSLRDLHAVFVAGFTLIFCICTCPSIYSTQRASDVGACSTVLYVITEQWSSAKKYRDVFEVVVEKMAESTRKYQESTAIATVHHFDSDASHTGVGSMGMTRESPNNGVGIHSRGSDRRRRTDANSLPSTDTDFMTEPTAQSSSHPVALADITEATSFHCEAEMSATSNLAMELDLQSDLYDIEGLLYDEGLEWFTDAVL